MERPLALRGHKRLYPDDDGGDEFGTDQSQEQSVVFVLFLISNNNSYLHKTTINRQNKLVTRASDSPRVVPKRQRSVLIFSRCPLSRCFTFRFPRLNASKPALLSSSASVTFFVRPSVSFCYLYQSLSCLFLSLAGCPSSCMSLPSQPLDICLISATTWAVLPYLSDLSLDYIGFSGVVGRLVISTL